MKYLTYINKEWKDGNVAIFGAMDNAVWLGSSVFDGARALKGRLPDLRKHLERVIVSSQKLGLQCPYTVDELEKLCREGVAQFPSDAEIYIRPLVFGTQGLLIPEKSGFALTLFEAALPAFTGFSACLSKLNRPDPSMAPTDAKASCLYPNTTRALIEAKNRGYENAVVCDSIGNVAEFATSNLFFVDQDNNVVTPVANGCFLSGITRAKVIELLKKENITVIERTVKVSDLLLAKEIFNTGNYGKVMPCTRFEDMALPVGEVSKKARELYMDFVQTQ
jgi:branched-chain amino acid aminotransferase